MDAQAHEGTAIRLMSEFADRNATPIAQLSRAEPLADRVRIMFAAS